MFLVSNDMTATLPARSSLRLVADPGEHVAVRCTEGELWLIRDGDPKDTSLAASESFTVPEAGTIDLYAVTRASLRVTRCRTGAAGTRGWRHWLARFLPSQRAGYSGTHR
ncbi:DUF2917 domain-containing protein [Cupriavidus oxalaticus]|uniref:DUF2917 domain-containing protein n=1 Tax=Cupriavidus oxalaticus TaxID=96344 RepID=A0A375GPT5_9BURK|nr:DUF2917 domain-containing protein [Cupriavidus oxalaticus]QEZ43322.1 DUF2917 domain-containing protein [Cupriavidus oxalaticus]QRQ85288.1 DUF2917 domain-containing protein [Cupriavidus oxalaticus]QRQ90624.1 DUF2917 domain-containing protein [Cupriavidus oxalaticus]WQD85145.1 DUF2917 domain-containing protein [Cupriavidus oxalaticus]SPC23656.1 conserved hypothetical protein [Cupriavidus oxalaticus]